MRAIAFQDFGGPESLKQMALPRPQPEKGEILVRVVAAGVNLVDCRIREGRLKDLIPHRFPIIPGFDVAGVVEELGEGSGGFRKGDRVFAYARKPTVQWGCYAEYVAVAEKSVAMMPTKLLFEEAASVPMAGLTAGQSLFGRPGVGRDSAVVIQGAAGGVGHFAVQLARNDGATVYATARGDDQSFVSGLGCAVTLGEVGENVNDALRRHVPDGADLVLDTVGGEALAASYDLVKPGGRLVSVVQEPDQERAQQLGINAHFVFAEPNSEQLHELARLFDRKKLTTHLQRIYSLSEARDAHVALDTTPVRGKLVLNL